MDKNISAIVLDLDGTFLNSAKRVSDRNLQAVLGCHAQGISIIIATARPPRAVQEFLPESLLAISYIVCYNGALIRHEGSGFREELLIEPDLAKRIHDFVIAEDPDAFISVEAADGRPYSNRKMAEMHYSTFGITDINMPHPVEPDELRELPALKILVPHPHLHTPLVKEFGERISVITTDKGELIHLASLSVAKHNAVEKVLASLDIPPENTMVFGDDLNDLSLFQFCGHPVAMGNAVTEVKEYAQEITASNDDDGVAIVLERVLANQKRNPNA